MGVRGQRDAPATRARRRYPSVPLAESNRQNTGCRAATIDFTKLELHLSVLIGTLSHPDMQKIRIIGFFF
jgi:hypothetical protein